MQDAFGEYYKVNNSNYIEKALADLQNYWRAMIINFKSIKIYILENI